MHQCHSFNNRNLFYFIVIEECLYNDLRMSAHCTYSIFVSYSTASCGVLSAMCGIAPSTDSSVCHLCDITRILPEVIHIWCIHFLLGFYNKRCIVFFKFGRHWLSIIEKLFREVAIFNMNKLRTLHYVNKHIMLHSYWCTGVII